MATNTAMLRASDLQRVTHSGFAQWLNILNTRYPARPSPYRHIEPVEKYFRVGRLTGYLTDISLHGRYRRENDQQVRRLNGTPGKWPVTPLHGSIVRDNPGRVLEVYESSFVWTRTVGAEAEEAKDPQHTTASVHLFPVPFGDQSNGVIAYSSDPTMTTDIGIDARIGSNIVGLEVDGGRRIRPATAMAIFKLALDRAEAACGRQKH